MAYGVVCLDGHYLVAQFKHNVDAHAFIKLVYGSEDGDRYVVINL